MTTITIPELIKSNNFLYSDESMEGVFRFICQGVEKYILFTDYRIVAFNKPQSLKTTLFSLPIDNIKKILVGDNGIRILCQNTEKVKVINTYFGLGTTKQSITNAIDSLSKSVNINHVSSIPEDKYMKKLGREAKIILGIFLMFIVGLFFSCNSQVRKTPTIANSNEETIETLSYQESQLINSCLRKKECVFQLRGSATNNPTMTFIVLNSTLELFETEDFDILRQRLKNEIIKARKNPALYSSTSRSAPFHKTELKNIKKTRSYSIIISHGFSDRGYLRIDEEAYINF